MEKYDWKKHGEIKKEWDELFSTLKEFLKDGKEHTINTALFTMVRTEPHVFKKSKILSIKHMISPYVGEMLSLKIENEDGQSWVNVYPQFELKTEGKIKDITLILMFIKDNIDKVNSALLRTETVIV